MLNFVVSSKVDQDQDGHRNGNHRREYHFDLSRIPEGEAVKAAEFRIYKEYVRARQENDTFSVSVYQVLAEPPYGWDLRTHSRTTS